MGWGLRLCSLHTLSHTLTHLHMHSHAYTLAHLFTQPHIRSQQVLTFTHSQVCTGTHPQPLFAHMYTLPLTPLNAHIQYAHSPTRSHPSSQDQMPGLSSCALGLAGGGAIQLAVEHSSRQEAWPREIPSPPGPLTLPFFPWRPDLVLGTLPTGWARDTLLSPGAWGHICCPQNWPLQM